MSELKFTIDGFEDKEYKSTEDIMDITSEIEYSREQIAKAFEVPVSFIFEEGD